MDRWADSPEKEAERVNEHCDVYKEMSIVKLASDPIHRRLGSVITQKQ